MLESLEGFEPTAVATAITQPWCHSLIPYWLQNATKKEIKGLKVISRVVNHKGEKLFKPVAVPTFTGQLPLKKQNYLQSS